MRPYEDIVDWSSDTYDIEDYETLEDWLEAIRSDFDRQKHYFPPEVLDELRKFWNTEKGDSVTNEDIEDIKSEASGDALDYVVNSAVKTHNRALRRLHEDAVDLAVERKEITIIKKDRKALKREVKELKQKNKELLTENKRLRRDLRKEKLQRAQAKRERRKSRHA